MSDPASSTSQHSSPRISKNHEECHRVFRKIQSMFPSVHMISSEQLMELKKENNDIILVDVRSKPEQSISMLEGAFGVDEADQILASARPNTHVITYCTVGFRACVEAKRLQMHYPKLKISSLDGIACYSHQQPSTANITKIVQPQTGHPVRQLHTFGDKWGNCAQEDYDIVHYDSPRIAAYSMQYGLGVAYRLLRGKLRSVFSQQG